jgi:hypothetical protein
MRSAVARAACSRSWRFTAARSTFIAARSTMVNPDRRVSLALIIATAEQLPRECAAIGWRRFPSGVRRAHPLDKVAELVVAQLSEVLLDS